MSAVGACRRNPALAEGSAFLLELHCGLWQAGDLNCNEDAQAETLFPSTRKNFSSYPTKTGEAIASNCKQHTESKVWLG